MPVVHAAVDDVLLQVLIGIGGGHGDGLHADGGHPQAGGGAGGAELQALQVVSGLHLAVGLSGGQDAGAVALQGDDLDGLPLGSNLGDLSGHVHEDLGAHLSGVDAVQGQLDELRDGELAGIEGRSAPGHVGIAGLDSAEGLAAAVQGTAVEDGELQGVGGVGGDIVAHQVAQVLHVLGALGDLRVMVGDDDLVLLALAGQAGGVAVAGLSGGAAGLSRGVVVAAGGEQSQAHSHGHDQGQDLAQFHSFFLLLVYFFPSSRGLTKLRARSGSSARGSCGGRQPAT